MINKIIVLHHNAKIDYLKYLDGFEVEGRVVEDMNLPVLIELINNYKGKASYLLYFSSYIDNFFSEKLIEILLKFIQAKDKSALFRVLDINGIGLDGSARLPLIDDNFFMINLKNMINKKLDKSKFKLSDLGGFNYDLLLFLENSFKKEDVEILRAKNLFDQHGDKKNYLMPFSIDEDNGIIFADLTYKHSFKSLIKYNNQKTLSKYQKIFFKIKNGYIYKRTFNPLRKTLSKILSIIRKLSNHEFIKK